MTSRTGYVLIAAGIGAVYGAQYAPAKLRGPLVLGGIVAGLVGLSRIGTSEEGLIGSIADDVFGPSADEIQTDGAVAPVSTRPMLVDDFDGPERFFVRQVAPPFAGSASRGLFSTDYHVRIEVGNRTNRDAAGELVLDVTEDYLFQDEIRVLFRDLGRIPARTAATFDILLATARAFVLSPTITGTATFEDGVGNLRWSVVS